MPARPRSLSFVCLVAILISMLVLAQSNRTPLRNPQDIPAAGLQKGVPEDPPQALQRSALPQRGARAFKGTRTQQGPAQTSGLNFANAVAYDSGGYSAISVAVTDVNGDGKPDVLVANSCLSDSNCDNGTVAVLLGNGDGTFQTAAPYGSGGYVAYSVAVADLTGKGKQDLVVANNCVSNSNCDNGTVAVLLGNGDGTFQTAVPYGSGGNQAQSVAVADVNGDGNPDLLVANYCASSNDCGSGSVAVLLGNGDGTFQTAVPYGSGGYGANSVTVAKLSGNGKFDLVVANDCVSSSNCHRGTVGVLLGNGDGTFQAAVSYGSGGYDAYSVAAADVNGDGWPDLLVANDCTDCTTNPTVGVLLGNGDGTFQTAVPYDSGGWRPFSVAVADVNGDSKPDLLVANWCATGNNCGDGSATVLLGNGDGTFQAAVAFASGALYSTSVAVADVNADGKPDLVLANGCASDDNCATGSVGVLINTSLTPTATALTSSANPSSFGQPVTFTATVTAQPGFDKGTPTGTVNFYDGTTNIGNSNLNGSGVATLTISTLSVGAHKITAVYGGDANFLGSSSPALKQLVYRCATTTTLTSSLNPSNYGQKVTFTATVSSTYGGIPTGWVSFYDNGTLMGTGHLADGVAEYSTRKLTRGKHTIKATYQGNSDYRGSWDTLVQTVN